MKKRSKLNASPLTQTEEFVFNMLAYELNDVPLPPTPAGINWDELLELAKRHAIMPLLYSAAKVMSDVPDKVIQTFRSAAIASAMNNERKLAAQDEVLKLLKANGIKCAVLKGTSCAVYYPHPELRQMGDIDILIEPCELEKVHELVQTIEYVYQEHQHEFHRSYVKNSSQTYLEIHYAISEFQARKKAQMVKDYLSTALKNTHVATIEQYAFPVLNSDLQQIALLVHIERHMFGAKIGLKQYIDVAMLLKRIEEWDFSLLDSFGLTLFAKVLSTINKERLCSFSETQDTKQRELSQLTLRKILDNGNTEGTIEQIMSHSFVKSISSNGEKSHENMIIQYTRNIRYKVNHEFPQLNNSFLLPFFYVYYPVRWWIRSLQGKRRHVSAIGIIHSATKEKILYDSLEIYRWKSTNSRLSRRSESR